MQDHISDYWSFCLRSKESKSSSNAARTLFLVSLISQAECSICFTGYLTIFTSYQSTLVSNQSDSPEKPSRGYPRSVGYSELLCSWYTASRPLGRPITMSQTWRLPLLIRWPWSKSRRIYRLFLSLEETTKWTLLE